MSAIAGFVAATDAALQRAFPGVRLVNFGHLGDGNLHYNVQAPDGRRRADVPATSHEHAVNTLVYDAVAAHGGSISAEHGIGALKRDELAQRKSPVALAMMRAIKPALDPHEPAESRPGALTPRPVGAVASRAPRRRSHAANSCTSGLPGAAADCIR